MGRRFRRQALLSGGAHRAQRDFTAAQDATDLHRAASQSGYAHAGEGDVVVIPDSRVVERDRPPALLAPEADLDRAVLDEDGAVVTLHKHLDFLLHLPAFVGEGPCHYGFGLEPVARQQVPLGVVAARSRLASLDPEGGAVRAHAVHLGVEHDAAGGGVWHAHAELQQVLLQGAAPEPVERRVALEGEVPDTEDLHIVQAHVGPRPPGHP
mmetsp:Transcript_68909/g.177576  ORF Transcript_68909/g.177576 Transcript_68909/m.177576 type:complete len:210 (-) Transcript_68909:20-649(-)